MYRVGENGVRFRKVKAIPGERDCSGPRDDEREQEDVSRVVEERKAGRDPAMAKGEVEE